MSFLRHRSSRLLVTGLLLSSALSGCSSLAQVLSEDEPSTRQSEPSRTGAAQDGTAGAGTELSRTQAERALLTLGHLSPKFELDDSEEDGDGEGPDWGCLLPDGLSAEEDESEQEGDAEVAFKARREPGMPGVLSSVFSSDGGEERATEAMAELAESYADCTHVSTKDDDGTVWEFDITTDTEVWAPGSDQQINVSASGSLEMESFTVPLEVRMTVVRVDATGAMVGFFDMTKAGGAATKAQRALVAAASERLAAVLAGKEPPTPRPLLADYEFTDLFEELLSQVDEDETQAV